MWHSSKLIQLINRILEKYDINILLTGTKEEYKYISEIQENCICKSSVVVLCDINISTLLFYIRHAKFLITNDTGPFHFARALSVPVIGIFGISPPQYLVKDNTSNCTCLRGTIKCEPECKINNLYENRCKEIYKPYGDNYPCINNVKVNDVINIVDEYFERF